MINDYVGRHPSKGVTTYSFLAFLGLGELVDIMGVQSVMDTTFRPPIVNPFTADWNYTKREGAVYKINKWNVAK